LKKLIVTADDFGLAIPVNAAIEQAHLSGILTAASLMVAGDAMLDAVARARRLPTLSVGLHLVVVCGRPMLPPDQISGLVGQDGMLSNDLVAAGVDFFIRPAVRRQLKAEIRAQFEGFVATGLRLDHVNAHKHMHLHPTVLGLILEVGRDYGMQALRVPKEPLLRSWRVGDRGMLAGLGTKIFLAPLIESMRRRLRRENLRCNDYLFGLSDSGHMVEERVLHFLGALPSGVSEIYFHPALGPRSGVEPSAKDYQHAEEFSALISPKVAQALRAAEIQPVAFSDLSG
jgi:hopanoid biosynthesis associated protein HpnK